MTSMPGKGARLDPKGHQVTPFDRLRARAGFGGIPDTASMAVAPIMDQGMTSSCVGHGIAGAIYTSLHPFGLDWVPSPRGIYTVGRCIDRVPDLKGNLPTLIDDGLMPNQAIRGIQEWGIRPTDNAMGDCTTSNINSEPTLGELVHSSELLLLGAYRIDSAGSQRIEDVCVGIAIGYGVSFTLWADNAFSNWKAGDPPLGRPNLKDPGVGLHHIYAASYRTENGQRIVRARNSWGTGYGDNGEVELSAEAFVFCSDITVLSVKKREL